MTVKTNRSWIPTWGRGFLSVALLSLSVSCSRADEAVEFPLDSTPVANENGGRVGSYADVLEPTRAAVVSVTTESIVRTMRGSGRGDPMEDFLRRFWGLPPGGGRGGQQAPEPEERRVPNGLGSGVIISADGYILTNNHVVTDERGEAADTILVQLNDGREIEAELIGRDERTDIALIKIEEEELPFVPIADSDNLRIGDVVFAIGNPLGVGQTTTMGIVSATGRTNLGILGQGGYENFIQTDAAINRGNSGGALVDAEGRLVGINSAIISPVGANIGIGFAIPSRIAKQVGESLIAHGEVRRGYLGVGIDDVTLAMAKTFNRDSTDGVLVTLVQEGTPAEEAGLQRDDIIVAIDGKAVEDANDLRFRVAARNPGTEIELTIEREGETLTKTVKLGDADDPDGKGFGTTSETILEGLRLESLTPELQQEWRLPEESGVLITNVDVRSPYASELQRGMVIMGVNGVKVESLEDLRSNLRAGSYNRLWVSFRGRMGTIAIRVR
jgi:serine protease Do/serine protease DegQ